MRCSAAIFGLILFLGVLAPPSAFAFDWRKWTGSFEPTKISALVMELENHYRKEISIHGYSVDFYSVGENAVDIKVVYRPTTDKKTIFLAVRNARELIRQKGQGKYGLYNIQIKAYWKEEGSLLWTPMGSE